MFRYCIYAGMFLKLISSILFLVIIFDLKSNGFRLVHGECCCGLVGWSRLSFCNGLSFHHRGNLRWRSSWCRRFCWGSCFGGRILCWLLGMRSIFIIVLLSSGKRFGNTPSSKGMTLSWCRPNFEATRWSCHEELKLKHGFCPIPSAFSSLSSFFRNPSWPTSASLRIRLHCGPCWAFLGGYGLFCWHLVLDPFSYCHGSGISSLAPTCRYWAHSCILCLLLDEPWAVIFFTKIPGWTMAP